MENSSYVDNVRKFRIGRSEKKKKKHTWTDRVPNATHT